MTCSHHIINTHLQWFIPGSIVLLLTGCGGDTGCEQSASTSSIAFSLDCSVAQPADTDTIVMHQADKITKRPSQAVIVDSYEDGLAEADALAEEDRFTRHQGHHTDDYGDSDGTDEDYDEGWEDGYEY